MMRNDSCEKLSGWDIAVVRNGPCEKSSDRILSCGKFSRGILSGEKMSSGSRYTVIEASILVL